MTTLLFIWIAFLIGKSPTKVPPNILSVIGIVTLSALAAAWDVCAISFVKSMWP